MLEKEVSPIFEISICKRDSQGNDTGQRIVYGSDSAYKIGEFWARNVGDIKAHRKKMKAPTDIEAKKILTEVEEYAKRKYGDKE